MKGGGSVLKLGFLVILEGEVKKNIANIPVTTVQLRYLCAAFHGFKKTIMAYFSQYSNLY